MQAHAAARALSPLRGADNCVLQGRSLKGRGREEGTTGGRRRPRPHAAPSGHTSQKWRGRRRMGGQEPRPQELKIEVGKRVRDQHPGRDFHGLHGTPTTVLEAQESQTSPLRRRQRGEAAGWALPFSGCCFWGGAREQRGGWRTATSPKNPPLKEPSTWAQTRETFRKHIRAHDAVGSHP
jgi:hypothetical protein